MVVLESDEKGALMATGRNLLTDVLLVFISEQIKLIVKRKLIRIYSFEVF